MNEKDKGFEILVQVQGSIQQIHNDISLIREDISGLKKDVSGLKEDVSELKGDVSELKQDVFQLKGDVLSLKQAQEVTNQRLGSLEQCQVAMQADIAVMKEDISNIKCQQSNDTEMLEIIIGQTAKLTGTQTIHGQNFERLKVAIVV